METGCKEEEGNNRRGKEKEATETNKGIQNVDEEWKRRKRRKRMKALVVS
jgi:hypothetical protein